MDIELEMERFTFKLDSIHIQSTCSKFDDIKRSLDIFKKSTLLENVFEAHLKDNLIKQIKRDSYWRYKKYLENHLDEILEKAKSCYVFRMDTELSRSYWIDGESDNHYNEYDITNMCSTNEWFYEREDGSTIIVYDLNGDIKATFKIKIDSQRTFTGNWISHQDFIFTYIPEGIIGNEETDSFKAGYLDGFRVRKFRTRPCPQYPRGYEKMDQEEYDRGYNKGLEG